MMIGVVGIKHPAERLAQIKLVSERLIVRDRLRYCPVKTDDPERKQETLGDGAVPHPWPAVYDTSAWTTRLAS
jgi:hypothetical protein